MCTACCVAAQVQIDIVGGPCLNMNRAAWFRRPPHLLCHPAHSLRPAPMVAVGCLSFLRASPAVHPQLAAKLQVGCSRERLAMGVQANSSWPSRCAGQVQQLPWIQRDVTPAAHVTCLHNRPFCRHNSLPCSPATRSGPTSTGWRQQPMCPPPRCLRRMLSWTGLHGAPRQRTSECLASCGPFCKAAARLLAESSAA